MNIESIKNYNQKMLALLSTLLVGLAIFALISIIVFFFTELVNISLPESPSLLSEETVAELEAQNKRKQIISFNSPLLVDSLNKVYLLPVTTLNLPNPEYADRPYLTRQSEKAGSSGRYYSGNYYGAFTNLMVYEYTGQNSYSISNKRFVGLDLQYTYFEDDIVLTFRAATNDTDKDGTISVNDFMILGLYSLANKSINWIETPGFTLQSYEFVKDSKDILLVLGNDRDKNGEFDSYTEPSVVKLLKYNSKSLESVVPDATIEALQKGIEQSANGQNK